MKVPASRVVDWLVVVLERRCLRCSLVVSMPSRTPLMILAAFTASVEGGTLSIVLESSSAVFMREELGLLESNMSTRFRFLFLGRWRRRLVRVFDDGVSKDREGSGCTLRMLQHLLEEKNRMF